MKILLLFLIALFFINITEAQNVGIGTTTPAASAQLDVSSTSKGLLPPRMTAAQRDLIVNPAAGLFIWCSNCGAFGEAQIFDGSLWLKMTSGPLGIGQSYQGGIVAYILQSGDPGYTANVQHGLIAVPSDQSTGTQWGCYGQNIPGADGTAFGTGNQNTIEIVNACSQGGIAARICNDLVLGGYSDWYLPSRDELNKLYLNRVAIGGFAEGSLYWSSSEFNNILAWNQSFTSGSQTQNDKDFSAYVRAVRAF